MKMFIIACFLAVTVHIGASLSGVTVEEGKKALLECPGFVPNSKETEYGDRDANAVFFWYKANQSEEPGTANRVAFLSKTNGNGRLNTQHDLENRSTIDATTGALEIPQTKVTDDHLYKCQFKDTGMGYYQNQTLLIITVTPSEKDLKVTTNHPGPAKEGDTIKFQCTVPRVKPLPLLMYWQFTTGTEHLGDKKTTRNADGLTSSVTVEYSVRAERSQNGRTLACHYVMSDGRILSSSVSTVQVLYKPSGKPSVSAESLMAKVNSRIALTCDSSTVDGVATWYEWQYNGNQQQNTSERTWFYDKWELEDKRTKLVFWCIAGNSLGQSNTSEPVEIAVDLGFKPNLTIAITCTVIGIGAVGCTAIAIVYCRKRKKTECEKSDAKGSVPQTINQDGDMYEDPDEMVAQDNKAGRLPTMMERDTYENTGAVQSSLNKITEDAVLNLMSTGYCTLETTPAAYVNVLAYEPLAFANPRDKEMPTYQELY